MAQDRFDVSDKVVLITGGGSGIGARYVEAFAEAGAIPVVADINGESASRVAKKITDGGGKSLALQTDIGSAEAVDEMVAAILDAYGRIDVLVNNAAVFSTLRRQKFYEIPLKDWEHVIHVNVTGNYYCARAVVAPMRAAGGGRIINIASATVPQGVPMLGHYVTSKAAIIGLTRIMARELGDDNINVNAVMPGRTETETERDTAPPDAVVAARIIKREETPDDLVGVVLFLASPASAFMTGQCVAVCGGEVML